MLAVVDDVNIVHYAAGVNPQNDFFLNFFHPEKPFKIKGLGTPAEGRVV